MTVTRRQALQGAVAGAAGLVYGAATGNGRKAFGKSNGKTLENYGQITDAVLETALLRVGKYHLPEDYACSVELIDTMFPNGIRLQELIELAARNNGWCGRSFNDDRVECLDRAIPPAANRRQSLGLVDLADVLKRVANRFLVQGFISADQSWRTIVPIESITDFKSVHAYRKEWPCGYKGISFGIECAPLGHRGNPKDDYGMLFDVQKQDFDNDDISAITRTEIDIGRMAGEKVSEEVWRWISLHGTRPAIVGFLHGGQAPVVDMVSVDPESTRIVFRGYHEFSVYRAG